MTFFPKLIIFCIFLLKFSEKSWNFQKKVQILFCKFFDNYLEIFWISFSICCLPSGDVYYQILRQSCYFSKSYSVHYVLWVVSFYRHCITQYRIVEMQNSLKNRRILRFWNSTVSSRVVDHPTPLTLGLSYDFTYRPHSGHIPQPPHTRPPTPNFEFELWFQKGCLRAERLQ